MPSNTDNEWHGCAIQTGPWDGPGSWVWKIYCMNRNCDFSDIAENRDDAAEVRAEHSRPGDIAEALGEDKEEEWEEFV